MVKKIKYPKYGDRKKYILDDGSHVSGVVIGVDNFQKYIMIAIKQDNGELYNLRMEKGN